MAGGNLRDGVSSNLFLFSFRVTLFFPPFPASPRTLPPQQHLGRHALEALWAPAWGARSGHALGACTRGMHSEHAHGAGTAIELQHLFKSGKP